MPNKTPRARIYGMLRQIFLRSAERSEAMKKTKYCCERCGVKQSQAKGKEIKLNVHHKNGIDIWDELIEMIRDKILCEPEDLEVLCKECHNAEHH